MEIIQRETDKYIDINCSLLHALDSVHQVKGNYSELHGVMNKDTETHLQFSVLFNFYILLIWLLLSVRTSVYIRVLLIKRMRRHTDGKTIVNIIIRQCLRFSGYFHALCCLHPLIASGFTPLSPTNSFVGSPFNVFSHKDLKRNVHIFIL